MKLSNRSIYSPGNAFVINLGLTIDRMVGKIVKLAKELLPITRAISSPSSESILNLESISTAKPAPTETALKRIAFPEP